MDESCRADSHGIIMDAKTAKLLSMMLQENQAGKKQVTGERQYITIIVPL